jgi:hypothetical protein
MGIKKLSQKNVKLFCDIANKCINNSFSCQRKTINSQTTPYICYELYYLFCPSTFFFFLVMV